ncbi:MAG: mucoidy inhibitor MuiA family protein, partial [Promethearchaeota archaeon]
MESNILETIIDSVIIYQKGVQITQKGSVSLKKGENFVKITELPELLDKESIRVKGLGNGKIINIDVEFNSKREFKKEEYKNLKERKEALEKELVKDAKSLNRTNEQIDKFKSVEDIFYQDFPKSFAFGEVDMSKFNEFNKTIESSIQQKTEKLSKFEDTIEELKKEIEVLNHKINNLGPLEEIHNFYDITINLNVFDPGDFSIEVRYTMEEAWWNAFYDVSLTEINAKITMMANIYNRTGLDWNEVSLQVSTASLQPIKFIKPKPMILTEYRPISDRSKRKILPSAAPRMAMREKKPDLYASGAPLEAEEEVIEEPASEIEQSYADVSEEFGIQSFKIPNRQDISSDRNPHPVNLITEELK